MRGCITRVRVVGLHGLFPADRAKGKDSDKDTDTRTTTRHPLPSEPTPTLSVSSVCPAQGWPGPAHPNCFPSLPPIQPAPLPGPVAFGTFCPLPDPRHALALPRALATYVSAPSSSTYSTRYLHVLLPEHPGRCARAASLALAHQRLTFHIHGPSLTRRLPSQAFTRRRVPAKLLVITLTHANSIPFSSRRWLDQVASTGLSLWQSSITRNNTTLGSLDWKLRKSLVTKFMSRRAAQIFSDPTSHVTILCFLVSTPRPVPCINTTPLASRNTISVSTLQET
ncbi:hypothetical protein J3E72DRAFT_412941 [Bipolaris maydis]|nr:hypothetical protein J3E72DRAFT_412941 [Bipolaris maydis]